jgi:hypothetical protein
MPPNQSGRRAARRASPASVLARRVRSLERQVARLRLEIEILSASARLGLDGWPRLPARSARPGGGEA